jgi:DNA-binding beta-propeller fold protein YncE
MTQSLFSKLPTLVRRVAALALVAAGTLLWISCGEVYRPVVIPIGITPPQSANFHEVFALSANAQANPGTVFQIDVSGDTNIGQANMGINPTHEAVLSNYSRVFVASAGSLFPGQSDFITAFSPAVDTTTATGLGTPSLYTLPNVGADQLSAITSISESGSVVSVVVTTPLLQAKVGGIIVIAGVTVTGSNPSGYDGSFTISSVSGTTIQYTNTITGLPSGSGGNATIPLPLYCSYLPDFVTTVQTTTVYVANFGQENGSACNFSSTDSIASLNVPTTTITNLVYLAPASHPIAMVETPNAQNLYVATEGNGTSPSNVLNLSPTDLATIASIPVGVNPAWIVARNDSQRVYVLTEGDGNLVPIDVATNTVLTSQTNLSVGVGANSLLYDPNLSRLYVTNPNTGNVFIYSTTGGFDPSGVPNDTPTLLATISMTAGTNPPCSSTCSPVSVAALPDGSRFYVASYELQSSCTDPYIGSSPCMIPMLTVFDALSMTVKTPSSTLLAPSPSLSLLIAPQFSSSQFAVPQVSSCVPPAIYTPGVQRFRMIATASADSSHVYVSICDAGTTADIDATTSAVTEGGTNTPDILITDLPAPYGICTTASCSSIAAITSFSISSGVATFQAVNVFTPGTQVTISGLTSTPGLLLDGITCNVLSTGLTATQFECIPSPTQANVSATTDSGTAVPQAPPQFPVFLLAGQ